MAVNYRFKARQIQSVNRQYSGVLLLFYFLFGLLFFAVPFVLQFFFNDEMWKIILKAVFFFVMSVLFPVVISAFRLGILRFFQKKATAKKEKLSKVFYYFRFSRILKATAFSICIFCLKALIFSVCFLPSIIFSVLIFKVISNGSFIDVTAALFFGFVALSVLCAYFYFRAARLLFLSKYLFAKDEELGIKECLMLSVRIMEKNTGKLFRLRFSFLFWFLSCIFFFPIFYVWSFYNQTLAVFAKELIEESTAT